MIVPQFLLKRTRLHGLLAIAAVLAAAALASNYRYWGPAAPHRPPAAGRREPAVSPWTGEIAQTRRRLVENPADLAARFRLSQLYFFDKQYPEALAELEVLQRAQPNDAEVYLRRAMVEKYTGQFTEAEKDVRRSLALRPQSDTAREWLGELYLDEGRSEEAQAIFDQCLKHKPDSYFALMGKSRAAEQLFLSGYPIGLSEITGPVEKAVRIAPNNPWGLVTLARMVFNYRLRSNEAEKLALRAAQFDSHDAEPYIILAEIALHRPATPENLRQAGLYALQAAERDPQDGRPPYQLGRALLRQNEPAEAVKLLEKSLAMRPSLETAYQLSLAYGRTGNGERAKYYSAIYQRWNDLMERRKTLLGELRREPRDPGSYYRLAELYLKADAPDPAENWLKKARYLDNNDPRYARLMAEVRRLRKTGSHAPMLPAP